MIFTFLDFELDEALFELRRRGQPLKVEARVFATLLCLVRNHGRIVTRFELTQSVWRDTVVSDAAVSQVVMLARKAVSDTGASSRIIRTIRGRGFRFTPLVTARAGTPQALPDNQVPLSASQPNLTPPGFVGREAELARLMGLFESVKRGRGSIVLLEGEPGSGRSSLAQELARQASLSGVEAVWGRAWEGAGSPPLWPWKVVLRTLGRRRGLECVRALSRAHAGQLAAFFPELPPDVGTVPSPAGDDSVSDVHARFRLFAALSHLLEALSAEAGLATLIVLEDLHCADAASLQVLRYVSERIAHLPVLLVATLDELASDVTHRLIDQLPCTADQVHRVHLRGLSRSEVASLLEAKLGSAPAARLLDNLYELSAGNPLLVTELAGCSQLHADDTAGSCVWDLVPIPERIVMTVRRHLDDLPESSLRVLASAAACGHELRVPWLAVLLSMSEAELLEVLTTRLRRWMVQAHSAGTWAFAHPWVRNAVYAALPARERLELHRRIAELIEARGWADPVALYELTHHYFLAGPGPARDKAIHYGQLAAEQAESVMAHEEAAGFYDRVVELLELAAEPQLARRYELLMRAGHALHRAGQLKAASARFERAANLSSRLEPPERYGIALCLSALVVRGTLLHDARATLRFEHALWRLPDGPSGLKALLLGVSALGVRAACSQQTRNVQIRQAVEMARRSGDRFALGWSLDVQHCAAWGVAAPGELAAIADEMLELSKQLADDELQLDAQLWRMVDHLELGDVARAHRECLGYAALARPSRSAFHRYMLLTLEASDCHSTGQLARARQLSERALALGRKIHEPLAEAFHEVRRLFWHVELGASEEGLDLSAPAQSPSQHVPEDYRAFWALLALRNGRREPAREWLARLCDSGGALECVLDALHLPIWACLARVSAWLTHTASAELLYARLLPHAERHLLLQAGVYLGPVAFYLGILAETLDLPVEAAHHFENALRTVQRSRIFQARTQFEYGQLLLRSTGSRRRGQQLLYDAELTARQLGIPDLLERARTWRASTWQLTPSGNLAAREVEG